MDKALPSHWHQTGEKTKTAHLALNLADVLVLCALPTIPGSASPYTVRVSVRVPVPPISHQAAAAGSSTSCLHGHRLLSIDHTPMFCLPYKLTSDCLPTHTQSHFFLLLCLSSTHCHSPSLLSLHCLPLSSFFTTYLRLLFQPLRLSLLTFLALARPSHPVARLTGYLLILLPRHRYHISHTGCVLREDAPGKVGSP